MSDPSQPNLTSTEFAYIISEVRIDPLENHISDAITRQPVAVTLSEDAAHKIVDQGGKIQGTGWPLPKQESLHRYTILVVPIICHV